MKWVARPYERMGLLGMPKKRFSAEQIVVLLRQIEVLMPQGKAAPVACREAWLKSAVFKISPFAEL